MRIALIDVDGHNFPNIALMKLSAYHKAQGDTVEWYYPLGDYDKVFASKVFTFTEWPQVNHPTIRGGSGYDLAVRLDEDIEHVFPDYSLYGINDTAYGYLTRGCPRHCGFCIVSEKEGGKSVIASPLKEFWHGQKKITLLDPNILAYSDCITLLRQLVSTKSYIDFTQGIDLRLLDDTRAKIIGDMKIDYIHGAFDLPEYEEQILRGLRLLLKYIPAYKIIIYTLTNYNTDFEWDLYRVKLLKSMMVKPYVMIYNKETADKKYKRLQRWCNTRMNCKFEEYARKAVFATGGSMNYSAGESV